MSGLYSELLLDEARNPRNKQAIEPADFSYVARNAGCGDVIELMLSVDPDTGKVTKVGWQGDGCIISLAAMSLLSDELVGKTKAEIEEIDVSLILEKMNTPDLSMGRVRCASLGLQATKAFTSADS